MHKSKFKETEIGKIPEEWTFEELDKHAKIIMGQSPESDCYNSDGNGTLFLQGIRTFGNLYPKYDTWTTKVTKLAKKDSVLLSVRAPVGEVNFADNDVCIGRGLMSIDGKNNKFIFYLFKAYKDYVMSKETGTVYGSVTRDDISKLQFPFPNSIEQEDIAKILSDLDSKIELNQQMNQTLEAIAQAIFKHWFVDFEFPNEKGKPYKSSGGKMIYNKGLEKEIPEGWEVKKVNNFIDLFIGRTPPRMQTEWFSKSTGMPWISIKDMGNSGTYIIKTNEFLTPSAVEKFRIPIIKKGTPIVSFKLTVGRIAIASTEMLSNEAIAQFNVPKNILSTEYLYLFLKNFDYTSLGSTSSIATAVNSESLRRINVLIPDSVTLKKFNSVVNPIFDKIFVKSIEDMNLESTRNLLLPKLMSGKIRVPVGARS